MRLRKSIPTYEILNVQNFEGMIALSTTKFLINKTKNEDITCFLSTKASISYVLTNAIIDVSIIKHP